jgi:queuosine precursor transporter
MSKEVSKFPIGSTKSESHFILMLYICLYISLALTSLMFVYKYINVGKWEIGVSGLIVPFWYALGDAITELFGYRVAKQLIVLNVITNVFFSIVVTIATYLPSSESWHHQDAYLYIFGSVLRVSLAAEASILVGGFLNAYFISKWRILLKGRFFWLRSLGSSLVGVVSQIFVAAILIYLGRLPLIQIGELVILTIVVHFTLSPIIVWPNSIIVFLIKTLLPSTHEVGISWNPFALTILKDDSDR